MKKISLLGSTGSIGTQCLEVAKKYEYSVRALCANNNIKLLEEQARLFKPGFVAVFNEEKAKDLKLRLKDTDIKVKSGEEGVIEAAAIDCDIVLNSIVGIAGLKPISIDSVGGGDFLEQEVTIHAEFPNVQDKHEIEDAIENLVLTASQFANRKS